MLMTKIEPWFPWLEVNAFPIKHHMILQHIVSEKEYNTCLFQFILLIFMCFFFMFYSNETNENSFLKGFQRST
jgi:hypothetical protein